MIPYRYAQVGAAIGFSAQSYRNHQDIVLLYFAVCTNTAEGLCELISLLPDHTDQPGTRHTQRIDSIEGKACMVAGGYKALHVLISLLLQRHHLFVQLFPEAAPIFQAFPAQPTDDE
jgi:hypothetical protein